MKILVGVAHAFSPKEGSAYSSQNTEKKETKERALFKATIGNIIRHSKKQWVHASLGNRGKIVTRQFETNIDQDLTIRLYVAKGANLAESLPKHKKLEVVEIELENKMELPLFATRHLLEHCEDYDIVGYIEDDISIEDEYFFQKLRCIQKDIPSEYAVIPHRCEKIEEYGEVILSGDPDGGRPDLFWATGEKITYNWPTGSITFYRATNPHSGCFFLSKEQANIVKGYWQERNWESTFTLSGPLEQAASGRLLSTLKIMKTIPEDYKFLKVVHNDCLWKRHEFEITNDRGT